MIIIDEIMSLDGWAARPDGSIDFFVDVESLVDSVGNAEGMSRVAAVLLGAQTYREFSEHWPGQDPAADVNRLPKHVLSTTLASAPWGEAPPASLERGDPADVARNLEDRYAGDVIAWGSLTVARALLTAGAVDELWLRVVPIALGTGRSFWPQRDLALRRVETAQQPGGWTTIRCRLDRQR